MISNPIVWIVVIGLILVEGFTFLHKEKKYALHIGILGLSFILGLSTIAYSLYQGKKGNTNLRVVGYANKLFTSDLVKWNLTLMRTAPLNGLENAYNKMAEDTQAFKNYLLEAGIEPKEIDIQPITSNPVYENFGSITSYNLTQNVLVLSDDLPKIENLSLNPEFFAKRGILLQRSALDYLYTKLPELKKQLLSEATTDAVARANEISSAAKVKLGKLRDARAGVFQITEPYSTEVSDYGIYNTGTKNKSISVTLTANFELR